MKRRCEFCRGLLEAQEKFCPHCGAPVPSQPEKKELAEDLVDGSPSIEKTVEFTEGSKPPRPGLEKEVRRKRKFPLAIILALLAFFVLRPSSKPLDEPEPQPDEPEIEEPIDLDEPEEPEVVEKEESPQGWHEEEGAIYYYTEEGHLLTGWQDLEGERYYFSGEGILQTGILKQDEGDYLTDEKGRLVYGLNDYEGSTYLTDDRGLLRTGWWDVEDKKYFFDKDGKRLEEKGGLIDFGRDPQESFTITSVYKDEIYFYDNMTEGDELRLSDIKSFIELPEIKGPKEKIDKLEEELDFKYFSLPKMDWEELVHYQKEQLVYDLGYTNIYRNSFRVFDSGDVSTLISRLDKDVRFDDYYLDFGSVIFVDNHSGQLVGPKEQIASMGEDPDEVLGRMRSFIGEILGKDPAQLAKKGDLGFLEFSDEAKEYYYERSQGSTPFFLNPMESFEHENVFLIVEDGELYMVALVNYFMIVEEGSTFYSNPQFLRVPYNYKLDDLEFSDDGHFLIKDYPGDSQDVSDIFHFFYD